MEANNRLLFYLPVSILFGNIPLSDQPSSTVLWHGACIHLLRICIRFLTKNPSHEKAQLYHRPGSAAHNDV